MAVLLAGRKVFEYVFRVTKSPTREVCGRLREFLRVFPQSGVEHRGE